MARSISWAGSVLICEDLRGATPLRGPLEQMTFVLKLVGELALAYVSPIDVNARGCSRLEFGQYPFRGKRYDDGKPKFIDDDSN